VSSKDRKKWTDFPPDIAAKAREIVDGGPVAFSDAANKLQGAVDAHDATAEAYWRAVFDCYPYVVTRKGRGMQSMTEYHLLMTASMYGAGDNPRYDPTQEEEFEKYIASDEGKRELAELNRRIHEAEADRTDDDLPF
jgi:hypothetical protein